MKGNNATKVTRLKNGNKLRITIPNNIVKECGVDVTKWACWRTVSTSKGMTVQINFLTAKEIAQFNEKTEAAMEVELKKKSGIV
ncbi:MAG: hypothetical protein FWG55_01495 [Candidatus Bathyarchaeota archaeon]|nr:hypothetical protein [Candidatus Termiticorpusculum sp.]